MKIYLIRHGIAALRETWTRPDNERPLTEKGRRRTAQVAAALRRLEGELTHLYTSPLLRARQTAEIIQKKLQIHKLEETALLQNDAAPADLLSFLNQHEDGATLGLVGHEPHLSALLGFLVTGRNTAFMTFKKAGVALVEGEVPAQAGGFTLRWLLEPGLLRRLARRT
ncbi:MAG: phosphohistidine phosphatase SixA [candidate division KSB1 bacterium]|nr:phosphohistidine phosphatase SixA [candidate division KSB1 bacterium]MDZ7273006.1 phosphohistidine phosphatase SixA [candidate division KSB1 bacterium]MDZ7285109.1 phosphohistidine phosphatase SixA [candidate division KSB1 bacterium]MDZ7298141.1 phosphohistidine phosphatase SixA [candidate division KSB1 bacterium]MDZ7308806.1 phosphohistidine phosphatase SixA [candidate division KSB1 bacterium]